MCTPQPSLPPQAWSHAFRGAAFNVVPRFSPAFSEQDTDVAMIVAGKAYRCTDAHPSRRAKPFLDSRTNRPCFGAGTFPLGALRGITPAVSIRTFVPPPPLPLPRERRTLAAMRNAFVCYSKRPLGVARRNEPPKAEVPQRGRGAEQGLERSRA